MIALPILQQLQTLLELAHFENAAKGTYADSCMHVDISLCVHVLILID